MKSKYLMIGASVCAALFLFSGVMLYRQYADEKQSAEAFDNIAALVQDETPPADEPQESETWTIVNNLDTKRRKEKRLK